MSAVGFSHELPFLVALPADVRAVVEATLQPVIFSFGEVIVGEGDEADAVYMLTAGRARLLTRAANGHEVPLEVLSAGDIFGEVGLPRGETRTETVRASGAVEAVKLDRNLLDGLIDARPEVRAWAEAEARRQDLRTFVRLHTALGMVDRAALDVLVEALEPMDAAAGAVIVGQGERMGWTYIVRTGRLQARRHGEDRIETVDLLRPGDVFGGGATTTDEQGVEALTDCRLLRLPGALLDRVIQEEPRVRRALDKRASRYGRRPIAQIPLDFADLLATPARSQRDLGADVSRQHDPHDVEWQADDTWPDVSPRRGRRVRRFPVVWQIDAMDCGVACLAMVARHFGRAVSLPWVREAVAVGSDGTSLRGLVNGAERIGLAARPLKASASRLDGLELPAICHWNGNHWVVLHHVSDRHVRVADPARGLRRMSRDDWLGRWSGYCCLLSPTPRLATAPRPRPAWRWLRPYARPHAITLLGGAGLGLVAAVLEMLIPVFAGLIVDRAVLPRDHLLLHTLTLGMIGMLLAAVAATVAQRWMLARLAVRFDVDTLSHMTRRLLGLPLAYFASRRTGDLERRLAGMRQVRTYVVQEGVLAMAAGCQMIAALVIMVIYSPLLASAFVATMPLYALAMAYARLRLRPLLAALEDGFGLYVSRQIDAIKGIETIKALGAEASVGRLMRRQFDDLAHRVFRADRAFMGYNAVIQAISFVTLAVVLWIGALLVLAGGLSLGELVAFQGLALLTIGPIGVLLRGWDDLQHATVLLGRIDDVLAREPEQGADRSLLRNVSSLGGQVEVRGLTVRAPGTRSGNILEDVNLEAQPGMTVAVVGRSGAGKTTLARCLAGLIEPAAGEILYDGVDLNTLDRRDLRRRIGFVLQANYLFDDTIAANIALGDDQSDMDRVRWAARLANAHDFIDELPLRYETRVGDTGLALAGGEVQRIAIARAIYRRPSVLILDEATSSLDPDAERAVKDGLRALLEHSTAFVIAHRLSTIRDADHIILLDRGRVAEQGRHEDLMRRRALYWQLVSQQLEG